MQRIVKEGQTFRRWDLSEDEARTALADEPYKLELIGLKGTPGGGTTAHRSRSVWAGCRSTRTCGATVRSPGRTCAAARTCRRRA